MSTNFLTHTINRLDEKEYSDILNTVSLDLCERKVRMSAFAVSSQYKQVSDKINSTSNPKPKKKSLKAMMQQSMLLGAGWMGQNYIA